MSEVPVTPPASGAAFCWNCQQPLQVGSVRCLWCGVAQTAPPAQLVVAPGAAVPPGVASSAVAPTGPAPSTARHAAPAPTAPRVPRGAATLGPTFAGVAAGTGARVVAFTLDVIVVGLVSGLTYFFTRSPILGGLAFVELVAILWVVEARTGLTVGNALLRLRVAREDAPYSPGVGRALVRLLLLGVGFLVFGIGAWIVVATSASDPTGRGRSWADRSARTLVVAVPRRAARPAPVAQTAVIPAGVVSVASGVPQVIPEAHPLPVEAPAQAPVVLAEPQVISTNARPSAIENSASASVTGVGAVPFAGTPLPAVEPAQETSARPAKSQGAPASDGTLLLVFDTGQREQLAPPVAVNLGRNPVATEVGDQLITVNDPESTVSKTHVRIEHSRGHTWVTDGGSTNGTDLLGEDGDIRTLRAGDRVELDEGTRVRIGNRTFTVSLLLGSEKES